MRLQRFTPQMSRSRKSSDTEGCLRRDFLEPRFWITFGLPTTREFRDDKRVNQDLAAVWNGIQDLSGD